MAPAVQTPPPAERLLTAEEYGALPDDGRRTELVDGKEVELPSPGFRHGVVCSRIDRRLGNYVEANDLGWVLSNDTGVVTRRDPDSVRGADVMYYSYGRMPKQEPPAGYAPVSPELIFEVKSPSDRARGTLAKVQEYHAAGVAVVCVVDPEAGWVDVHPSGQPVRRYAGDEAVELPELFPDFRVPVRAFLD